MRLTDEQIELYSRQIILREVGGTGQQKLRDARVLVLGGGAAYDACTSYLAGAGIGELTLVPEHPASGLPALAPVASRTPEVRVRSVVATAIGDLDQYDVVLRLPSYAPAALDGHAEVLGTAGRPTTGSIVLAHAPDGLELHLLRRDHGCVACLATSESLAPGAVSAEVGPHAHEADPSQVIAEAGAGTLAALACCRWLVGIGDELGARTMRLSRGAVAWDEERPPRRVRCPRGCPPPDEPV